MRHQNRYIVWVIGVLLLAFAAGCKKKIAVAPPPPAPTAAPVEAAKPSPPTIAEFTTEPRTIQRGQSATLRWQVKDATEIEISRGIGSVPASGRQSIAPGDSTTYTLVAKGPGGSVTADTTLNVTAPPPPPPPLPPAPIPTISERLSKEVQDAFFDFDRSDLRDYARTALTGDAGALKIIMTDFPNATIVIEGHCDERGSAEYNLGLGDRRASAAKEFLTQLGVPGDRLVKVSYGKERPQCTESAEACWQKNRRVHFVPGEDQHGGSVGELDEPGRGQVKVRQADN
jgi:peptidoglycan-associated lipoprotein